MGGSLTSLVVDNVANLLAIETLISHARDVKMTTAEREQANSKVSLLQPGDLILTKTPSVIYAFCRGLGHSDFDHIAVVLNDTSWCLHVSYPKAKTVPTHLFTHVKREPTILRPRFDSEQHREAFLRRVTQDTLGKSYDYYRVV